jgi:hypothetical protein
LAASFGPGGQSVNGPLSAIYKLELARHRRSDQTSVTIAAATSQMPSKAVPTGKVKKARYPKATATAKDVAISTPINGHGSAALIGMVQPSASATTPPVRRIMIGPKVNRRRRTSGTPSATKG